jgi:hypothetical protein
MSNEVDARVILESVVKSRVITPRRADNQSLEIRIDRGRRQTQSKSFAEMLGCLLAKQGETIKL